MTRIISFQVFDAGNAFQIMCVQISQDNDDNDEDDGGGDDKDDDTENVAETNGGDESVEQSWKVVVSAEEGIKCQDQRQYVLISLLTRKLDFRVLEQLRHKLASSAIETYS